jgi:molecular chaperone GrpE
LQVGTAEPTASTIADEAVAEGELLSELEMSRQELSAVKDQLLRMAADFDNFRKRSRREVADALLRGKEELLRELLPVFDNLERATAHAAVGADLKTFVEGIEMVMKQFRDSLSRAGIERVPTVGTAFDPTVHEAIQHVEMPDCAPGAVAAEVQGGYRLAGRLIRAALVVVAKAASDRNGEGVGQSAEEPA